jgi:hypothetical protein
MKGNIANSAPKVTVGSKETAVRKIKISAKPRQPSKHFPKNWWLHPTKPFTNEEICDL